MSEVRKLHVVASSKEEYDRQLPNRLSADKINDGQAYNLMMENTGTGPEAFVAPVYVREVLHVMSTVALKVYFTDIDLRPIGLGQRSSIKRDLWFPIRPVPLQSETTHGEARIGYLLPYDDEFDDDLIKAFEQLSQYA